MGCKQESPNISLPGIGACRRYAIVRRYSCGLRESSAFVGAARVNSTDSRQESERNLPTRRERREPRGAPAGIIAFSMSHMHGNRRGDSCVAGSHASFGSDIQVIAKQCPFHPTQTGRTSRSHLQAHPQKVVEGGKTGGSVSTGDVASVFWVVHDGYLMQLGS